MVGRGRVELPTSRLSGVRSNHLSYRPVTGPAEAAAAKVEDRRISAPAGLAIRPGRERARINERRKRNGDGATAALLFVLPEKDCLKSSRASRE
jgi:hypothetical protein